jgi:ABC-type phosphate transport system auxiliary subunit
MKITISASMSFAVEIKKVQLFLEKAGHEVFIPSETDDHLNNKDLKEISSEIAHSHFQKLMKSHFDKIKKSDALIVLNYDKRGISGYIGSSTFCEINSALAEGVKIYLLNSIPDIPYISEDLHCLNIEILNNDLSVFK